VLRRALSLDLESHLLPAIRPLVGPAWLVYRIPVSRILPGDFSL
jgi:hypothetical protein